MWFRDTVFAISASIYLAIVPPAYARDKIVNGRVAITDSRLTELRLKKGDTFRLKKGDTAKDIKIFYSRPELIEADGGKVQYGFISSLRGVKSADAHESKLTFIATKHSTCVSISGFQIEFDNTCWQKVIPKVAKSKAKPEIPVIDEPGTQRFYEIKPLAEATIYQYGGPETSTRCIAYDIDIRIDPTNGIKTCTQWATDVYQHGYYLQMWGPSDIDKSQVEEIKNSCFVSAIAAQIPYLKDVISFDTAVQFFNSRRPMMEAALLSCIKTTEILGKIYVKDFRLELTRRDFW